ncbi:hypothetical protein [Halorussus litoreus]|uniref:hypothetical protein n=1 Tax=Halorussus litoreus TaxID=1710536 RepID=UPI000E23E0B2|nr:hypothetical protein [Halorussus litoreus]
MEMPDRRRVLQSTGAGALALISGCSAFANSSPPEAIISGVYVTNHHEEPHTVHLLIFDQESEEPMEPVYFRSKTFGANDPDAKFQVGGGLFEGLPTEPSNYHVEIRLDGREWDTVDVSYYDNLPDRINIGITIGYTFKETGPPAWKVTVSEPKDETTDTDT